MKGREEPTKSRCFCPYCQEELLFERLPYCQPCRVVLRYCLRCQIVVERKAKVCPQCHEPLE
ncbi:MAG: hypothetical protein IBX36_04325 [Dehalococcoidia bacterium]|nr:hypothetical protein [Dehalococcoidia bacterium]